MAKQPERSEKRLHRKVVDKEGSPPKSEQFYRHLIEQAPGVIWRWRTVPPEGFDYVSPAASALLGSVERFIDAENEALNAEDRGISEAFKSSGVDEGVLMTRLSREDGSVVWVECTMTVERDDAGAIVAIEGLTRDITERLQSLDEVEADRNEFLGALARELRNPAAALKGAVALTAQAGESVDASGTGEFIRIADEQADCLLTLANNLLETTDVEKASFSLKTAPLNISNVLEEAESIFHRSGFPNELQVEVPEFVLPVLADKPRLLRVLTHLLANAAKFSTASAPIVLSVEYGDLFATVHIKWQGHGVPEARLHSLLYRSSESKRSGNGPLHFGLAISRKIVEAHGGRIWASSEGEGSTFSFSIPVAQQQPESRAMMRTLLGGKGPSSVIRRGSRTTIMGVDDDPQTLKLVRTFIEEAGYRFVAATGPAQALKLVQEEEPALVLLDIRLPGSNGFELLQRIRKVSDSPVIFLSVSTQQDDIVRGLQLGGDDYIFKPFSPPELLARIESVLRRRPEPRAADEVVIVDGLEVDLAKRMVTRDGKEVSLSATEYKLLHELALHAGLVLTHRQILHRVWGPEYESEVEIVRAFIRNLRQKLGDNARHPRYIITHPGIGYRLVKPN